MIEELKRKLKDYYGAAIPFNPVAMSDFINLDNMTDEEIIEEAKKNHITL